MSSNDIHTVDRYFESSTRKYWVVCLDNGAAVMVWKDSNAEPKIGDRYRHQPMVGDAHDIDTYVRCV